jgi:broad-specificity NMP kinase
MDCEIMQEILSEAMESYKPEIIWERSSNTPEDMEATVEAVSGWMTEWNARRSGA